MSHPTGEHPCSVFGRRTGMVSLFWTLWTFPNLNPEMLDRREACAKRGADSTDSSDSLQQPCLKEPDLVVSLWTIAAALQRGLFSWHCDLHFEIAFQPAEWSAKYTLCPILPNYAIKQKSLQSKVIPISCDRTI